ncbi:8-oxo-dGTP diphosphatase [Prauserella sediminis]|uniref:8-oxo-dGTP diphosphatase n=1 Tax=Prauserella sediminis TaxID=577680 RepID=A0A839XYW4_9PSEU|nr:NUDIX hydrolase [Prauserella sediminis]MBB3666308.1 8-oxo-dGTP diphosphatase [Prauserella sediminis]
MDDESWSPPQVLVAVDLVILTLRAGVLQVLMVERGIEPYRGALALPGGFLYDEREDLLGAARRELREEADLEPERLHLEQFGAYGAPDRDPRGRVVSVAYLAIAPGLPEPVAGGDAAGASWRPVQEVASGRSCLAFDHRQVLTDGLELARSKLERSSLATTFCGETFTIAELQRVYEAVWETSLDPRNFYRKVQGASGFVVPAESEPRPTKGRPARLFRAGPSTVLYPAITRPDTAEQEDGA